MAYQDFTSLPPEQERTFVVYEQYSTEASKKAITMGAIAGGIVGLLAIILFLSFDAPKNPHAADEGPSELGIDKVKPKKVTPAPAPAPAEATPTEGAAAPSPDDGAAATADSADGAGAAAPAEAPEPPKGATKAPPTALIH